MQFDQLDSLNAISPIDGRYHSQTEVLTEYFSEQALIKYRIRIEIEYILALNEIPLSALNGLETASHELRLIYQNFNRTDALEIKALEKTTNHDVKAVEYFIKKKFDHAGLGRFKEYVHFGLTSQDINNTAIPLSLKEGLENVYLPAIRQVWSKIMLLAESWKDIPMLAHTHGQPASPTRLGKELLVFTERLEQQLKLLAQIPHAAKFGGATGNLNAHVAAYPEINWLAFANSFVSEKLGLKRSQHTTQIEHYDHLAAQFDTLKRINTILIDFSRDIWMYISANYFKQSINENETGSSAMPHKVNPIDFENAEGNLGIANALFEHMSAKLPISRLQRDLSDSTVLRNIGVPLAHGLISFRSLLKGLDKLILNQSAINKDLSENWAVIAEAIQTILRREGFPKPYETLKEFTRTNSELTEKSLHQFIDSLDITKELKIELKGLSPFTYTGI